MKKNLFRVLFGVLVFFVGVSVHAAKAPEVGGVTLDDISEGADGSVVVGEVATPVYTANIFWDDLTFDWTYDDATNTFGWAPASLCEKEYVMVDDSEFLAKLENGEIYTDTSCSTVTTERTEDDVYYSVRDRDYVYITIEDLSENGRIVPSIEWNPTADYSYTTGTFEIRDEKCIAVTREDVYTMAKEFGTGLYSESTCATKATDTGYESGKYYAVARMGYAPITGAELPDSARNSAAGSGGHIEDLDIILENPVYAENQYSLRFSLGTTTQPTTTPTAGATIGSITVSFRAK